MTSASPTSIAPHNRHDRPSTYAWVIVALLFVVAVLNYTDRLMITTMLKPIQGEFQIDNSQVGLFTSVFLWVYAAVSPLGGFLADRFGKRWVIVVSLVFWSGATCLSGFAHSFHELLFARGLMGISEACYMPAALAIIADFHRGRTRSRTTALHMIGIYAGTALGGAGGFIAERYGWKFGFRVFGAFGILYGLMLAITLRDAPVEEQQISDTPSPESTPRFGDIMSALLASPGFRVLFAVNVLVGIINWSLYGWLPTFLQERFGHSIGNSMAGMTATICNVSGAFGGVLLGGFLADGWARSNRRARALVPGIAFCIGGPCLMTAGTSLTLAVVIITLIIVGIGRGALDANHMPALRDLVDQRYSATGFGMLNFINTAVGGLMVYASGKLQDANAHKPDGTPIKHADVNSLAHVFQTCGIAMLIGGVLLLLIRFPRRAAQDAA